MMDFSGEKLLSNAIVQFLPGMLETQGAVAAKQKLKAANVVGKMEKISLSVFSHLLFSLEGSLNHQQGWKTIFPLLFWWERKEGYLPAGKKCFFETSYKSFFLLCADCRKFSL